MNTNSATEIDWENQKYSYYSIDVIERYRASVNFGFLVTLIVVLLAVCLEWYYAKSVDYRVLLFFIQLLIHFWLTRNGNLRAEHFGKRMVLGKHLHNPD